MKVPPENSGETCEGGSRQSEMGGTPEGARGPASQAGDTPTGTQCPQLGSAACLSSPLTSALCPPPGNGEVLGIGQGLQLLVGGRETFLFLLVESLNLSVPQFLILKREQKQYLCHRVALKLYMSEYR